MRCGLSGDGAWIFRPLRAAGRIAGAVRGLSRRRQGVVAAQGRAQFRAEGQGDEGRTGASERFAGPDDRFRQLQPFPGDRPRRAQPSVSQRSGIGAEGGDTGGVRRQFHRSGLGVRKGRRLCARRHAAAAGAFLAASDARPRLGAVFSRSSSLWCWSCRGSWCPCSRRSLSITSWCGRSTIGWYRC